MWVKASEEISARLGGAFASNARHMHRQSFSVSRKRYFYIIKLHLSEYQSIVFYSIFVIFLSFGRCSCGTPIPARNSVLPSGWLTQNLKPKPQHIIADSYSCPQFSAPIRMTTQNPKHYWLPMKKAGLSHDRSGFRLK